MLCLGLMFALATAPLVMESGEAPATLVELFTSEGCSSCPPADARLAKFRDDPGLWREVVPVAFHVDYWDGLGWPDRFARPEFTARQREYAARWGTSTIYTPAFVSNGREGLATVSSIGRPGRLRAEQVQGDRLAVTFVPTDAAAGPLVVDVAPLAGGFVSDVRRGENGGRRLAHEFVALALITTPLVREDGTWSASVSLPAEMEVPIDAVAVWVHRADDPTPIQATGGWWKQ